MTRRRFLQLTSGVTSLALLSACVTTPAVPAPESTAAPTNDQPQRGGVLRVTMTDDVTTLDPGTSVGVADVQAAYLVYETLIRRAENEPGAPLYPVLAEARETNEDVHCLYFHLALGRHLPTWHGLYRQRCRIFDQPPARSSLGRRRVRLARRH